MVHPLAWRGNLMRLFSALLVCGISLSSTAGMASDLVVAPAAPTVVASESIDWSGFYAGFSVGYGLGNVDAVDLQAFPDGDGAEFGTIAPEGFTGGVQAGVNVQHGSMVFGIEAGLGGADYSGESEETIDGVATTASTSVDWYGTLGARAGVAVGPALIYGTAGLAAGGLHGTIEAIGPGDEYGLLETSEDAALGYTVGAGVEYKVSDQVSLVGAYQFVHLGQDVTGTVEDSFGNDLGIEPSSTVNAGVHNFKVGLNYHF
jgi:outer membrane immunogenic protein